MNYITELDKHGYNSLIDELVWHLEKHGVPTSISKTIKDGIHGYEFNIPKMEISFLEVDKQQCEGEAMLIRYADDFVCAFQHYRDAKHFYRNLLPQRMSRFGLELAPDKTRLLRFSSFGGDKNERFEFLGYEFRQGLNRHLKPQVNGRLYRDAFKNITTIPN